ncbi:TetR/AcrR family transcriptional regulator [Marinibacterium sp. SX1]|uniref:TetR/AcrR family transcriptional regulator n=1 Tax=Marinibacterium sp. SX1 TaxID=3388424 RepID=UPI003D163767
MNEISPDTKQQTILQAAMTAFASYGFRKTSMDDIARGANMSRPALYTHFRNKKAILRSLVEMHYDEAASQVGQALRSEGSVSMRLHRAFVAQAGRMADMLLSSPHGMELLETGTGAALDLVEAGEARLRDVYADWLAEEMAAGRIDLRKSPHHVAATLTSALKGLKKPGTELQDYLSALETLAVLVGQGLAIR